LIELCKRHQVKPVLHMITDGRDTPPRSALTYLPPLESALQEAGGDIATVSGRYYAMDRDNRWDRTERAWQTLVHGAGKSAANARTAIEAAYADGKGDEFILPTAIKNGARIQSGDQVIFFNFRKDRTRQITEALSQQHFDRFAREGFTPATVTCMTEYDKQYRMPYAFDQDRPHTTLAEVISTAGLKQFHCAETEKYPHVTYFLNGGRNEPFPGEDRVIVPSPKVATYDLQPEMSAPEVADAVIEAIESGEYAFVVVNFANGDMVGHSGLREAILQCVQAMDREVGRVIDSAVEHGYSVMLSADHGNCEEYVDPVTGEPHTQHTVYPVPCLVLDEANWQLSIGAGLSSIAPTVLQLMGLPVPKAMTGRSLLLKAQSA
jgi:2,3-bisphosphoglycerate-independent phosphoglycerate mutase